MTNTEYTRSQVSARREVARLSLSGGRQIRREYIRLIGKVAQVIRRNENKLFLEEQVRGAFPRQELYAFLKDLVISGRRKAIRLVTDVDKRYVLEALDKVPGHGLDTAKVGKLFDGIADSRTMANSADMKYRYVNAREKKYTGTAFGIGTVGGITGQMDVHTEYTFRQSHSLSKSIWGAVNDTEDKILDVVWGGISQGRDIRSVSQDLMKYVAEGSQVVLGRWGKLLPGTAEYTKRFGKAGIDYRAMRLYRSELYRNMQEAAVEDGEKNPACTGEYDWILQPGRETWNCDCPEVAAAGPYTADNIPPYQHPNCFIAGTKIEMDNGIKEIQDIKAGDYVLTENIKSGLVSAKVLNTTETEYTGDMILIYAEKTDEYGNIDKYSAEATPDHPFFRDTYEIICAKDIKKGMRLSVAEDIGATVTRVDRVFEKTVVYNLTVEKEHTYIANGFLVHNCDCMVQARLKDHDEFIQQLRDYVQWKDTPGAKEIERWAQGNGLEDRSNTGITELEGDINNELKDLYNQGIVTGKERITFMSAESGIKITTRQGKASGYEMADTLIKQLEELPENSIIVLHNHPSGGSFSADDLFDLLRIKSIKEIRVIGHNKIIYKMDIAGGIRPKGGSLAKIDFKKIYDAYLGDHFIKYWTDNSISKDVMLYYITTETNNDIALKFNWKYDDKERLNGKK